MTAHPPIFACARMDDLKARAAAGDARAIAILLRLLPADLPPAERQRQRDHEIQRLAAELRATLSDLKPSTHLLARILLEDAKAMHLLSIDERRRLHEEIASIKAWPARWPRMRAITDIIEAGGVCSKSD